MKKNKFRHIGHIYIINDSITLQKVDAIVNDANASLLGGAGIDGKIHQAAGSQLFEECKTLGGCKVGQAKMTDSYQLPCRKIIHVVAPIWNGGTGQEDKYLASCYKSALDIAVKNQFKSIAFPCIGTILYDYPKLQAAQIAVDIMQEYINEEKFSGDILICCVTQQDVQVYKSLLPPIPKNPSDLDDVSDLDTNHPRGKKIYQKMQEIVTNKYRIQDNDKQYAANIIYACNDKGYDIPIKKELMFEFLEKAEQEDKYIKIVPDDEYLSGGSCHEQLDGWSFHPILIDKEDR